MRGIPQESVIAPAVIWLTCWKTVSAIFQCLWNIFSSPQVWVDAGTQVFFSYAVCQGVLTSLGSYNKYNNNCYRWLTPERCSMFAVYRFAAFLLWISGRDCLALCFLNSFTSIFAGFAVFSVLGFMAHGLDLPLPDVAVSGELITFSNLIYILFAWRVDELMHRSRSDFYSLSKGSVHATWILLLGCTLLPHDPFFGPGYSGITASIMSSSVLMWANVSHVHMCSLCV